MSLRHIFSEAPYERQLTLSERSTLLQQERVLHKLRGLSGTIGLCSCGHSFCDATKSNVLWRFDSHVQECLKQLENRLDGVSNE